MKSILHHMKACCLTILVLASFVMSSFGWRHIESSEQTRLIVAGTILFLMYVLMIFDLINRTLASLVGAVCSVVAYDCLIQRVSIERVLGWLDVETLSLLFGMMILVNVLATTGLFNYLAVWCYQKSNGHFWLLLAAMSLITATLSAFMDNVSTMLLMTPTLIKLAELEQIDPKYLLMIMIIFCNIGGCATPIGDPPNLIIIGDSLVTGPLQVTFSSFVGYCSPCVLLTMATLFIFLKVTYKTRSSFRACVSSKHSNAGKRFSTSTRSFNAIEERKQKLLRLVERLRKSLYSFDQSYVCVPFAPRDGPLVEKLNNELERQIEVFERELGEVGGDRQVKCQVEPTSEPVAGVGRAARKETERELDELSRLHSIKSVPTLTLSLVVLVIVILLFFVQSWLGLDLTLGRISLFAGLIVLVASSSLPMATIGTIKDNGNDQRKNYTDVVEESSGNTEESDRKSDNFELVIDNVEWSTLMFFFSLFIVTEVMDELGLINCVGRQITDLMELMPAGRMRSVGAISLVLWASALASACIDNVPFASMMIKVLGSISRDTDSQLATVRSLVFALVFGTCYGGNGSLIGASANLVTAGLAARHNYPISFNAFLKFTAPFTLLSLAVANLYLVLVFVLLEL